MSIAIDNFSVAVDEIVDISSNYTISVDATDVTYGISTSGTIFKLDGVEVFTVLSGINDGYRIYYEVPNNLTASGVIFLTANVTNNNQEVASNDYGFLVGYHVEVVDAIKLVPNRHTSIIIEASNSVVKPNTVSYILNFSTMDLDSYDLGASIRAIQCLDLGAKIYPQSPVFYLGMTFTVTVSGIKDFHGNYMPPFSYTFTIED